ncbi:MAG: hypothetical protein O3A96_00540, partial [Proteobacteria bacterium]|nr:hypothetical protein [Pseudomonadota bacterium]
MDAAGEDRRQGRFDLADLLGPDYIERGAVLLAQLDSPARAVEGLLGFKTSIEPQSRIRSRAPAASIRGS